jgi:uncharacterized Zn-finger protein
MVDTRAAPADGRVAGAAVCAQLILVARRSCAVARKSASTSDERTACFTRGTEDAAMLKLRSPRPRSSGHAGPPHARVDAATPYPLLATDRKSGIPLSSWPPAGKRRQSSADYSSLTFDARPCGPSAQDRSRMCLPKFHNEPASPEVCIGVTQFACIGVLPPHDHPHVYLAIEDATIVCPYCSTLFRFDPRLDVKATEPPGLYFEEPG